MKVKTGLRISIEVTDVEFQEEVGINVDLNLTYLLFTPALH